MRNIILFVTVAAVIIAAMLIGDTRSRVSAMPVAPSVGAGVDTSSSLSSTISPPPTKAAPTPTAKQLPAVPSIGSIQVLNGCGAEGAANRVADFLRAKGFDVKDLGNA